MLTEDDINEFKALYKHRFGVDLTAAEARREAMDLVLLMRMLIELDES